MDAVSTSHSVSSVCSLPEGRLQLAKKKAEQLERRRKLDIEQSRLQYEREKCELNDVVELAELEIQLENDTCRDAPLFDECRSDPGACYTKPLDVSLPSVTTRDNVLNTRQSQPEPGLHVIDAHHRLFTPPPPSVVYERNDLQISTCNSETPPLDRSVVVDNISHVPISTEHEHANNELPVSGVDVMNNAPSNNYAYHSNYPVPPAVNYIPTINYQDSYYQQTPAPLYHGMQYINSNPNINRHETRSQGFHPSAVPRSSSPFLQPMLQRVPHELGSPLPLPPHVQGTSGIYQHGAYESMAAAIRDTIALPKPVLLEFDGDPKKYISFINNFQNNVANRISDYGLKLTYLIQHCKGAAQESIANYVVIDNPEKAYIEALKTLKSRYGRPHVIAQAYVKDVIDGPPLKPNDITALCDLGHQMQKCDLTLQSLGYTADLNNSSNLLRITRRLPFHIRNRWVDKADVIIEGGSEPTFKQLTDFIMARARIGSNMYGIDITTHNPSTPTGYSKSHQRKRPNTIMTTHGATSVQSTNYHHNCIFCNSADHRIWSCDDFKQNNDYKQRLQFTRSKGLCDNCLSIGHRSRNCKKLKFCREKDCTTAYKHNGLLHRPKQMEEAEASSFHTTTKVRKVFLRVVPVTVRYKNNTRDVYALVDQCSNTTLCSKKLARQLRADGVHKRLNISTVNNARSVDTMEIALTASALNGTECIHLDHVFSVDILPINTDIPVMADLNEYPYLDDVQLQELPNKEISLLIGSDCPAAFREISPRVEGHPNELYALHTVLGWSVIGPTHGCTKNKCSVNFIQHETTDDSLHNKVEMLWNTDFGDLYSDECAMSPLDKRALDIVEQSINLDEGQYTVALPWREEPPPLINNRAMVEARLRMLRKRLEKNAVMKVMYTDTMRGYIEKGYVRKCPINCDRTSPVNYLPHHPVMHPKKKKLRIVFDCAARFQGQCINDLLLQGPDGTNSLLGVLLRFRAHPIAVAADIKEMFHQVKVDDDNRNALRLLWWDNNDPTEQPSDYELTCHTFGLTSSPFVCNYVLKYLAEKNESLFHTETIDTVKNNFYVDDCLKSVKTDNEAITLVSELSRLLSLGGFDLTKWVSNSPDVMSHIDEDKRAPSLLNFDLNHRDNITERMLGVSWEVNTDSFIFTPILNDKPYTRRGILSMTSSFFDPIGFFSPVILSAKLILQEITRQNVSWDAEISDNIKSRWIKWLSTLHTISDLKIKRCYIPHNFGPILKREVHCFADASSIGYGAVAYIRSINEMGEIHTSFIMGKARLAPLKSVSIPRLELLAATLAVKVQRTVKHELGLIYDDVYYWTDSTTVLYYLRNQEKRYKIFVANRVAAIRDNSKIEDWRYVNTEDNPADYASRGMYGDEDMSIWLNGPPFLQKSNTEWPIQPEHLPLIYPVEVKADTHVITVKGCAIEELMEHHSSWYKIKRLMAWLMRYKTYCMRKYLQRNIDAPRDDLTVDELLTAEKNIVKVIQKRCFNLDYDTLRKREAVSKCSNLIRLSPIMRDEIIRVGGRLQHAPISSDEKHQIILPSKHHISDVIIRHYHTSNGHVGIEDTLAYVRQKYWIINGRSVVKSVLSKCHICTRQNARLQEQYMAPLPAERLIPNMAAFTYVGIDYFGPLYVKQKRSHVKRYGCIFVCYTTRAVHLEVAHSLDTDSFLCCFQRFINRRGTPQKCFSDNGTNLTAGERELRECIDDWNQRKINRTLQKKNIKWHFNTPTASHMGGVWERLIRSTKNILRKILREQIVNDEVLMTVFTEVERILNDRPLTKVSTDPRDEDVLTPNMLLLLKKNECDPAGQFDANEDYTRRSWRQSQHLSNTFWKRWMRQYLPTLQERQKWNVVRDNIKVGDIVLLCDERIPRGRWPLARVIKTKPDRQGHVRSVEVWSQGSKKSRPISKLVLMEKHVS